MSAAAIVVPEVRCPTTATTRLSSRSCWATAMERAVDAESSRESRTSSWEPRIWLALTSWTASRAARSMDLPRVSLNGPAMPMTTGSSALRHPARVADAAAAVVGTRAGGSGHGFDATQGRAAVADTDEARRRTGYIPGAFDRIGSGLAAGDAATRRATGRRLHGGSRHRAV